MQGEPSSSSTAVAAAVPGVLTSHRSLNPLGAAGGSAPNVEGVASGDLPDVRARVGAEHATP
jgi:hypothetical protein